MNLSINNKTLVKNIQEEFTTLYPYLKIEFLTDTKTSNGYAKVEKIAPTTYFKLLHKLEHEIEICINNNRTVADLEKDFKNFIGLSVQLYRKSGNVWIETSLTDDWTLARQNDAGEVLSGHIEKKNN